MIVQIGNLHYEKAATIGTGFGVFKSTLFPNSKIIVKIRLKISLLNLTNYTAFSEIIFQCENGGMTTIYWYVLYIEWIVKLPGTHYVNIVSKVFIVPWN